MTTEIMTQVLTTLDHKLDVENRKGLLFLDNAPSHLETPQGNFQNIKLASLPKNTTSQLQPCDAGVIRNFKIKYRKQYLKHVISNINNGKKASDIIRGVDLLQCMRWVNQAFQQIAKEMIKHCSEKCGFSEVSLLAEEPDGKFKDLINVQKKGWEDILRK